MSIIFKILGKSYSIDEFFKDTNDTEYQIIEQLGTGGNSVVFRVTDSSLPDEQNTSFAMKILKYRDSDSKSSFENEKKVLKEFSGDGYKNNFVTLVSEGIISLTHVRKKGRKRYEDITTYDHNFYLMDLADRDIQDFMCSSEFDNEKEIFPYILQLAESLMYIHQKDYVHRDIKPQNILLHGDVPKISDFGLTVKENACHKKKGPKYWPTPEFLELCNTEEHCARKATDVFQLGCIFFYLLTKKYPIGNVCIDEIDSRYKMKPIIEKMISYDKTRRYIDGVEVYKDLKSI